MSNLMAGLVYQDVFLPDFTTCWCNWITWKYCAVGQKHILPMLSF